MRSGLKSWLHIILVGIALLCILGCTDTDVKTEPEPELRKMKKFWMARLHEGYADSVIALTRPYYEKVKSVSDTAAALSGLHLSQAYTLKENADSAKYYLKEVYPLVNRLKDPMIKILYYNVKGALALKYDLDYPASLAAYDQGLRIARKAGHLRGMTTMLSSIVYIYYVIEDPHGMQYAKEVRTIADSLGNGDPIANAHAGIAMALMEVTNNNYKSALANLDKLDSLVEAHRLYQLSTISYATRGEIYTDIGSYEKAERYYTKAMEFMAQAEPSMGVMALYGFGKEKEKRGDFTAADSLYERALDLSIKYNNLEYRANILLGLAKLHLKNDNSRQEALGFFESYHNHIDSLHKTRMVQDFNNLILENHNLERQTEIQQIRIAHLYTQKLIILFGSLIGVLIVVIVSMVLFYRKRRNLFNAQARRLMEQSKRDSSDNTTGNNEGKGESIPDCEKQEGQALRDLFMRIEETMKTDKIYRSKALSLESLADSLGSNRTYVSRAVNKYSGASFSSYVNRFRISEAVCLLSDPDSDILLKEVAEKVGFGSDSVFSRIFKKETGMSPKEFRQSALDISQEQPGEGD